MNPTSAVKTLLRKDWTQAAIAQAIGVKQPTIFRINSGYSTSFEIGTKLVKLASSGRKPPRRNGK